MSFNVQSFLKSFFKSVATPFGVMSPRDVSWQGAALFAAFLLPFIYVGAHAAPQIFDFCLGRFIHLGLIDGAVAQYNIDGHQFLGRSFNLIPLLFVSAWNLDYFYVYATFCLLGILAFILFSRWMTQQLLPTSPRATKIVAATSLAIALLGNAPSIRDLVFALPGFFTYTLPGLLMAVLFLCLYRALAAQRDFSIIERIWLFAATPLIAMSNEWSSLALMGLLLCAFITRLRLVPDYPAPITHALLLALSIVGALLVLLGPQNPVFVLQNLGVGALWSVAYTPEFFLLRLPLPGVLGWLLLLSLAYRPELRAETLSDRHWQLLTFTLVSLGMMSLIAFTFGYVPSASRLSARAQNQLFIVVLVAISVALCLVVPIIRHHLSLWAAKRGLAGRQWPLLQIALLLSLLSPGIIKAFWQMSDVSEFRDQSRTRVAIMVNRAEPTVYIPQISAQPSLLFDRDVRPNADNWRNSCTADFFKLEKVLPQPETDEIN